MSSFEGYDADELRLDPTEFIDVGECGSCPRVKSCLEQVVEATEQKQAIINGVTNSDFDRFVEESFDEATDSGFVNIMEHVIEQRIDDSESLAKAVRKMSASKIEDADFVIAERSADIDFMTVGCGGALKMRAAKAGRIVTATICNSPQVMDGASAEIVSLHRDREM